MKKIKAIGGSNSKSSINKTLATYVAGQVANTALTVVDLNDFDLPLYGTDLETESGIPENAMRLNALIESADGLVISLAEHNGSYSAVFKNIIDWLSRIDKEVWKNKPMLLMATSPGERGGIGVLENAKMVFPYLGGNLIATFSLPSFYDNFSDNGLKNEQLNKDLNQKIKLFQDAVFSE